MSKKGKIVNIQMGHYPFDLMVFFYTSPKRVRKELRRVCPEEYHPGIRENFTGRYDARSVRMPDGRCVTHFVKPITHGIITHELHHVTQFLMEHLGMPMNDSNCEAYAYLIQFLTDQLYDFMRHNQLNPI